MTVLAMKVLPRPVGRVTSVFSKRAERTILNWYVRKVLSAGYTQVWAFASLSSESGSAPLFSLIVNFSLSRFLSSCSCCRNAAETLYYILSVAISSKF